MTMKIILTVLLLASLIANGVQYRSNEESRSTVSELSTHIQEQSNAWMFHTNETHNQHFSSITSQFNQMKGKIEVLQRMQKYPELDNILAEMHKMCVTGMDNGLEYTRHMIQALNDSYSKMKSTPHH